MQHVARLAKHQSNYLSSHARRVVKVEGSMTTNTPPTSRVISSRRIFPATPTPAGKPTVTRLSIVDATVVRFTPCAAVWLFEPSEVSQNGALLLDNFELSLRQTLDSYPHFAGQAR